MSPESSLPTELATEIGTVAAALHRRGLAWPAWAIVESMRPLGWLCGQALLMGEPLLRGFGLDGPIGFWQRVLEDEVALAALGEALNPAATSGPEGI